MPYLLPIETPSSNIENIDVANGNLIFDNTNHRLYYDNSNFERISLSSVELIPTENDRLNYVGAKEGKLYIVVENVRPYIFKNGQWATLTITKVDPYSTFYVNPDTGDDDNNDGLSSGTAFRTINAVFSKYYDLVDYRVILANGIYNVGTLNINKKTNVILKGNGDNVEINGTININNVTQFEIYSCGINELNVRYNSYAKIDGSRIYYNGINAEEGSAVYINNSNVSGSVASDTDALFRAYSGSHIILLGVSGNIDNRKLYHADMGSTVHISGSSILYTSYSTIYSVSGTGKIFFEEDSIDTSTKIYVESSISSVQAEVNKNADAISEINDADTGILATSKKYTDEQIEELFGIEEVL